ncbi:MAG: hypothetical protein U5N85_12835 [Arcicella sp.]|nr:hypothetical protein [Arcicella sp.]
MKTLSALLLCSFFALKVSAQIPDSSKIAKDTTKKKVLILNTYNPNPLGKINNKSAKHNDKIDLKIDNTQKKVESNYIMKDGRVVGGKSTLRLGKKN